MDNKVGNLEKLFTMIYFLMNSVHSCSYRNMKRRNNSRLFESTSRTFTVFSKMSTAPYT